MAPTTAALADARPHATRIVRATARATPSLRAMHTADRATACTTPTGDRTHLIKTEVEVSVTTVSGRSHRTQNIAAVHN